MHRKLFILIISLISCLFFLPLLSQGGSVKVEKITEQQAVPVQKTDINDEISDDLADKPQQPRTVFFSNWLHMLDKQEIDGIENSSVMAFGPQVPGDLARILKPAGGGKGVLGLLNVIFRSILSIC